MPVTYGQGQGDAIRTRLPGQADARTLGEQARDTSEAFSGLPRLQPVDVLNQTFTNPMFVGMKFKPKLVIVGVRLTQDPETSTTVLGPGVTFSWRGDGILVRAIDGLTSGAGIRYDFAFLGVG